MGSKIEDQPPPRAGTSTPAWDLVIRYVDDNYDDVKDVLADMRERHRIGTERYGTALTSDNGRNHVIDAYQELLDAAAYLRAELDRRGIDPDGLRQPSREIVGFDAFLVGTFKDLIESIIDLRAELD